MECGREAGVVFWVPEGFLWRGVVRRELRVPVWGEKCGAGEQASVFGDKFVWWEVGVGFLEQ